MASEVKEYTLTQNEKRNIMYLPTNEALKELRKIGRENNCTFKVTSELHNGNTAYAFYNKDIENTRESTTQSLKNWRDDLCNNELSVNF